MSGLRRAITIGGRNMSLSSLDDDVVPVVLNSRAAMLTAPQVAELLDLSISSIRRAIRCGQLPAHRFGRSVRISEADLAAFVARRRSGDEP